MGKPELGNAKVQQRDETKAALIQGWLCSVEGLHAMGSKRFRTVIQTDESLSPKSSWANSEAWAVLKSPDLLSILERSCRQFVHGPANAEPPPKAKPIHE